MSMKLWGSSALTKALMSLRPGQTGMYVADTAVHTGDWAKLTAMVDTVVATITSDSITPVAGSTLTAITIKAGASFEGHITSFTLTSGAVMAYNLP